MSRAFLKGELDKEFRNLERHRSNPSKNKKSDIELQTTSCHGVKKASKRSKPKQSGYKSIAPLDLKKILSKQNQQNSDKTKDNVQKLLAFSETTQLNSTSKSNIIEHNNKSKRHYEPKSRNFLKNLKGSRVKKESSLFTEEDFDRFSKEYFLHSEPINKSTLLKVKQKEMEN